MTDNKRHNLTQKQKFVVLVIVIAVVITIYVLSVFLLFNRFARNYKNDIVDESAMHLIDINSQISLLVEEDNDMSWRATNSMLHSILEYDELDVEKMFKFMEEEQEIWGISDTYIITEDGSCTNTSRSTLPNDKVSDMVVEARASTEKRLLSIQKSALTYTMLAPDDSTLTYNGSRIVAVSTVKSLRTLIDNMEFSSFDGNAYLYLAENKGAKISQLTHADALDVSNVYSLFDGHNLTCLYHEDGHSLKDEDNYEGACVYLDSTAADRLYVVVTPVDIDEAAPLKLFYVVPESAVNENTNSFSTRTTQLSIYLIVSFFVLIFTVFLVVYLLRGKKFAREIAAREHMFDLLVVNTKNAYGLLQLNNDTPLYITKNTSMILGDDYFTLHYENDRYKLVSNSPASVTNALSLINDALKDWDGKSDFSSEHIPYTVDGKKCYFVFKLYPAADDENYIAIVQDITVEHEREDALRSTLVLADSANIAKTRFLSNMSHDIRTPMNAIVNMTDFAIDSMDDKKKLGEYLNVIKDSSGHLLHLINDILDMSRIESGKMVIESEPFDMLDMLGDVEEMIRVLANQKNQHLVVTHDIKTSKLLGDRMKVSQILLNLLNNAVKYTNDGGTVIFTATEIHSLKSELGVFRFVIKDDGIGIAKEKLGEIFEPFVRVDDKQVEKIEGTGLGLSICKNFVEAMGGFLSVTSIEGKGSTFIAELHFNKDFSNTEVVEKTIDDKPASFIGKRVLLVEDNQINRKVATMILSKFGFVVETAYDGREGLNMFTASVPGYYDLIYMDVQMPVMNGYESTAAIRDSAHPQAKTIPIIAMTANVFAEDIEKSRVSGMDGHVGKPIVIDELVTITEKVFREKNIK